MLSDLWETALSDDVGMFFHSGQVIPVQEPRP